MNVEFTLNTGVCTECMECVESCPTEAFYYQDGFKLDDSKCSFDQVCQDVCPEQCLEVNRV